MWTGILSAIAGIATILGVLKYWTQIATYFTKPNVDKDNQSIDEQELKNKQQAESSGRPV